MRCRRVLISCLLLVSALSLAMGGRQPLEAEYTTDFGLDGGDTLIPVGANPFFTLNPGTTLRLEGEDDGQPVATELTVLQQTRQIRLRLEGGPMIATTRIVEERQWVAGELTQVALNYLACCPISGNIYNFGEAATQYANGEIVGHEGSWMAGVDRARPGLLMPGSFLLGSRYHQELAPQVSMGRAENVAMGLTVETPAGVFRDCVMVLETSPLEPDEEVLKVYAPGVGLIVDDALELVETHPAIAW